MTDNDKDHNARAHQKIPKVIEGLFYITSALLFSTFIVIFIWAREQGPIAVYEITPTTRVVKAGDYLEYDVRMQWRSICDVMVERVFIDSENIRRVVAAENVTPTQTGYDEFHVAILVPTDMPAGPATFNASFHYECNPYHAWFPQDVKIPIPPLRFLVTKDE